MEQVKEQVEQKEEVQKEEATKVEEGKEKTPETEEVPEIEGLSPEEAKMAKEHGLLDEKKADAEKEGGEGKEKTEDKEKESKGEEGEKKGEEVDYGNDEEELKSPDIDPEKVKKYSKNEVTLYVRQKKAVRQAMQYESQNQLLKVQNDALRRENELLKGKGNIDDIDRKLDADLNNDDSDENDNDKLLTVGELEKREKAKTEKADKLRAEAIEMEKRMDTQYKEATAVYDKEYGEGHFSYVLDLAKDMVAKDKTEVYGRKLFAEAADPEGNAAEVAWHIGRLHPDYDPNKMKTKETKKEGSKNFKKIVANAEKKTSSAALGGASGDSKISEEDLTPDDVVSYSQEQWNKLKPETRERLLKAT